MTLFGTIVWAGALLTLVGVAALVWCIAVVARARRQGLDDAAMRARMARVIVINMAALAVSGIGLMLVILGIVLGP